MTYLLALIRTPTNGALVHFMIDFLITVCVLACVIVIVRWLLGLAGIQIPQPLMIVLGIMLFLVVLLWLLDFTGLYIF